MKKKLSGTLKKSKKLAKVWILFFLTFFTFSAQGAIFEIEAEGIYGGFWRDLYKFGPVVIDTVGADFGIFWTDSLKTGFSFATLVGLLSDNEDHDIFGSISQSSKQHNKVLNALDPADFSYSTVAFKTEYIVKEGDIFGISTTGNLGVGIMAHNPNFQNEKSDTLSHYYGSLGVATIIKITKNFRMSFGISYRKDFDANKNDRPEGFENFDAVSIYNHVYLVKF